MGLISAILQLPARILSNLGKKFEEILIPVDMAKRCTQIVSLTLRFYRLKMQENVSFEITFLKICSRVENAREIYKKGLKKIKEKSICLGG